MNQVIALLLPPAVALSGLRLLRLLLGVEFPPYFGAGLRFALGLACGMLVFTQTLLLTALSGLNAAGFLGKAALVWGSIEFALLIRPNLKRVREIKIRRAHLWLLLLLPLVYFFWVFGRLAVVEGTMEFDGVAHWLMKSKIMYLKQGHEFLQLAHDPSLTYVHWDYPLLVSGLYALNYGALGGVDEFVNKVWPLWMLFSLCAAILSWANFWQRPRLLPVAVVLLVCFLPATLCYVRWEGGTIPMVFYTSLAAMLIVRALARNEVSTLAVALLLLTGCAMTKFEGIIFATLWGGVLLPIGWRRQWLGQALIQKIALVSFICVLPYVVFRLNNPVRHVQSDWPALAARSPGSVLENLPKALELTWERRFFSRDYARWILADDGELEWIGRATGWRTLINYQLDVLPWLILFILGISLWRKHCHQAITWLTVVIMGVLMTLALVIATLAQLDGYGPIFILNVTGESVGRYFYPFFMAWFLGIVSTWLTAAGTFEPPPPLQTTG